MLVPTGPVMGSSRTAVWDDGNSIKVLDTTETAMLTQATATGKKADSDIKAPHPFVSVVIPVRNERTHIGECLDALLEQDYPARCTEIVIIDGMSDDGTRDILDEYARRHSNLRVLDNPAGLTPVAMNLGITNSRGEIIVRIDARCICDEDYVGQCVKYLESTGAQNVGGMQKAIGDDYWTRVFSLATTSPFGIGNSKFHYSNKEQFVDTVYLGAFRRKVFDEIGLYDESLIRNQDYELNHRIRKAGGKIFFTPNIRCVYYGRNSIAKLFKQYFQFGFWKVRVLKKHPASLKARHLAAPALILFLVVGALLSVHETGRLFLLGLLGMYGSASLIASAWALKKSDLKHAVPLPLVFAIIHLSWGSGFWLSLFKSFRRATS